jgi:hypothetical protein
VRDIRRIVASNLTLFRSTQAILVLFGALICG